MSSSNPVSPRRARLQWLPVILGLLCGGAAHAHPGLMHGHAGEDVKLRFFTESEPPPGYRESRNYRFYRFSVYERDAPRHAHRVTETRVH